MSYVFSQRPKLNQLLSDAPGMLGCFAARPSWSPPAAKNAAESLIRVQFLSSVSELPACMKLHARAPNPFSLDYSDDVMRGAGWVHMILFPGEGQGLCCLCSFFRYSRGAWLYPLVLQSLELTHFMAAIKTRHCPRFSHERGLNKVKATEEAFFPSVEQNVSIIGRLKRALHRYSAVLT